MLTTTTVAPTTTVTDAPITLPPQATVVTATQTTVDSTTSLPTLLNQTSTTFHVATTANNTVTPSLNVTTETNDIAQQRDAATALTDQWWFLLVIVLAGCIVLSGLGLIVCLFIRRRRSVDPDNKVDVSMSASTATNNDTIYGAPPVSHSQTYGAPPDNGIYGAAPDIASGDTVIYGGAPNMPQCGVVDEQYDYDATSAPLDGEYHAPPSTIDFQ